MGIKIVPALIILFGILARLIPHPANFAPITAIALFSGVYLPKKYAFILPIGVLFLSDLFIGFYGATMLFVYGSFILSGLIGLWLKNHKNLFTILGSSFFASILFYLITNFAVWLYPHSFYTKDLSGLLQSYVMAIPFFRNTLLGDLFYIVVFFGGYELAYVLAKHYLSKRLSNMAF